MSSRSRRERGAAAVEMALVLPLLILLLGGIIDFGRAFMTEVILTNAAREGSRMALIDRDATTAASSIDTRATAAANGIDTVTVTPTPSDGCSASGATQVTVEVSTSFNWLLLDTLPGITNPQTLTGTSVIGC
jgi:Flp pilus assembly protein TadG